jgi:hypothetical protein
MCFLPAAVWRAVVKRSSSLAVKHADTPFINSNAYQWCGQLRVHEPVGFA